MFDAIALAAVADELNEKILRGRVQEIFALDELTFGFEIYAHQKRQYLFITARADDARVHLASQKLRASGIPVSPFLLLLRKHAENAFIDAVTQIPNERVLKIIFDHSAEGISTLVIETIGRYSNLILLDTDAIILDAARRITPSLNRARTLLPRQIYAPPPPQNKLDPGTLSTESLATLLNKNRGEGIARTLVQNIAGVSPLLAREVEHRITLALVGSARVASPVGAKQSLKAKNEIASSQSALLAKTLEQLSHAPWQPSIAYEDDVASARGINESKNEANPSWVDTSEPSAFAPYIITHLPKHQTFDSISAAIENFYGTEEQYAALKETIATNIRASREKLARKRDSLASSLPKQEEIERLRTSGELVLAYASQIRAGQKALKADSGNGIVSIALDMKLSPVENAQKYFKEYHRAKDAAVRVPALLQAAQADVDYADQILNDLDMAENRTEIEVVAQSARDARLIVESQKPRVKITPSEPRAFLSLDGFTILIGKNAKQNEEVTFKRAQASDLWLHVRNFAGAHVVILGNGRGVPESTVTQAAQLAAQNSQGRNESRVDVIVTERKNVRKPRGAKPGMVLVRNERVVRVEV